MLVDPTSTQRLNFTNLIQKQFAANKERLRDFFSRLMAKVGFNG